MKSQTISYMPGYTGHIPKVQREENIEKINHTKHLPGNIIVIF